MLTSEQASAIWTREKAFRLWLGDRTSYKPEDVPANLQPLSNDERSALEVFEFCRDKPERYFLFINVGKQLATTWTGDKLGTVTFGKTWHDTFGATRVSIRIDAINGCTYAGTYFKSTGDYARVKRVKTRA